MTNRKPPDFRTLDDLDMRINVADAAQIGMWMQSAHRPNLWRRFWVWALLGWKWTGPEH